MSTRTNQITEVLASLTFLCLVAVSLPDSARAQCEASVTHEPRSVGESWSVPGTFMFYEDAVPVFTAIFDWGYGTGFGGCAISDTPITGFGIAKYMDFGDACNYYNIAALGLAVDRVTFQAFSGGQFVNLAANGGGTIVAPLESLDGVSLAPGVSVSLIVTPIMGGVVADVTVMGDVHNLTFGGQDAALDNLCVVGHEPPFLRCDNLAHHQSLPLGEVYGDIEGPGEMIFTENDIDAFIMEFQPDLLLTLFGEATVVSTILPNLDRQKLHLEDVTVEYNVTALGREVEQVTIRFYEPASAPSVENVVVNGLLYRGQIQDLPPDYFPDVTAAVSTAFGVPDRWGVLYLDGDVRRLQIGGHDIYVDDVCFILGDEASPVISRDRTGLDIQEISPNPCNPRTEIRYSLQEAGRVRMDVFNLRGQRVRRLMDEHQTPESVSPVVWNGRTDNGDLAASGMYFVRIESGGQVATSKVALIK